MTTLSDHLFQVGDVLNHKWVILERGISTSLS